jgi:hypothetical protein
MKKLLLLLLLIPFIGIGQINTFPWTNDFESYIALEEDTTDDNDWALRSGSTPSPNTGPQGDHTTGSGVYYYTEASVNGVGYPYKTFISYTPTFDITQSPGKIVSFWYHMYGNNMGDLEIGVLDNNGYTILNTISGNQGDEWHLAYYTIQSTDSFKIQFTGTTGPYWDSDICIDDLYVGDPYVIGCMDPLANNYDPSAVVDDGSCTYPPCGGFASYNAYQMCWGNQTAIQFEWLGDTTYSQCDVTGIHVGDENGWSMFYGGYWPAQNGWHGFAAAVGNGQMPPNWSIEHYAVLELTDGNLSDTIFYTPTSCIPGCTDSTAVSYNPWATIDDGSCGGTICDPATEQQITMSIRLDNWPQETGWELVTNAGPNVQTPSGTYTYNDIGVTYNYTFCVSATAGFELILTDTYGDGIQGNGTAGSAGEVVIYDCNGDTITYLSSGAWVDGNSTPVNVDFGTVAYSTPQNGVACATAPDIFGCTDPTYQEYNPLANIDDSTCTNLHIYGCVDSTAYNYDPTASIMDIVPSCNYTLWIGDGAADGWGNSYLGVRQGSNTWTFTMGPGSYSQTFPLTLDTDIPVEVYYFEVPNAQNPDPQQTTFQTMQNSFKLINADSVVLMHEGGNPFANNGQGALQGFGPPFWMVYDDMPFCGDYCIPAVFGCIDPLAFNYDPLANTDDGNCIPVILGCTNDLAINYDSTANTDDGSCIAEVIGCMDTTAFNYNPSANTMDSASCVPVIYGCMDDTMFNYNAAANTSDNSCIPVVFGCTDALAYNYDPLANTNNGSCIPFVYGCTNPAAINFDPLANTDDSTCIGVIYGCTDITMYNYDPLANTDNGSCIPFMYGCTDSTQFNYDPLANTDNGTCVPFIYGCTDPSALNFNPNANTDDFSCILPIYGCMDSTAFNYDPNANVDNGSCVPFIFGCTNPLALNYCDSCNTDDFSCILPIYGCTDSTMFNYNPLANVDNNSCIPFIYGCTDPSMLNYNAQANTEDFSCIAYIYGCMDSTALNYDSTANTDNGSCVAVVEGCMDQNAWNYNLLANVNDSLSCLYDAGCIGDPGDPYWLNDECYAWVISVDDYCCDNEWDNVCQLTYDYCSGNWTGPQPPARWVEQQILIYPNPTKGVVNFNMLLDVAVYSSIGELIIEEKNVNTVDISNFSKGIYHFAIKYQNKIVNYNIVKN